MNATFMTPEAVSPQDAQRVLDFLNSARTGEDIARAIEISGERDVGIGVAQRILRRREELGEFQSLQQVADVDQVGPERFTEIIATLTGTGVSQLSVGALTSRLANLELMFTEFKQLFNVVGGVPAIGILASITLGGGFPLGRTDTKKTGNEVCTGALPVSYNPRLLAW